MKNWKFIFFALFTFFCTDLWAEDIYINYDNACVDQMEYLVIENDRARPYLVYRVRLGGDQYVYLDVGSETLSSFQNPTQRVNNCDDLNRWNRETVRRINSGLTNVYIVRRDVDGQNIVAASSAAYYIKNGSRLDYENADFDFVANTEYVNSGTTISSSASSSIISMETYALFDCTKLFTMRQTPGNSSVQAARFQFVPEFGIIQYQTGLYGDNQATSELKLNKINGTSFGEIMITNCGGLSNSDIVTTRNGNNGSVYTGGSTTSSSGSTSGGTSGGYTNGGYTNDGYTGGGIYVGHINPDGTTTYAETYNNGQHHTDYSSGNNSDVYTGSTSNGSTSNSSANTFNPPTNDCGITPTAGYHVVNKGETLYRISKRYGVTLTELQAWNGLANNLISPCQQLRISANAGNTGTYVQNNNLPNNNNSNTSTHSTGSSFQGQNNTGAANNTQTQPDNFGAKNAVERTDMLWLNGQQYYVVKDGETVAQLAKRFGYTPERFRYINGLRDYELIRAGQRLRTTDCNCVEAPASYNDYDSIDAPILTDKGATSSVIGKKVHTVQETETLYAIAKKYNTSVDRIRALNGISEQEIIIPFQRIRVQ